MSTAVTTLVFYVNGKKVVDENVDPELTLLQYLRYKLKLCGTKLGCGEGGCGACTVMVSKMDRDTNTIRHYSVNACLAPVCTMHGFAVTTVEGIGSTKTKLHPVQERIAKAHGSQCGFCTPGIVMSMYTLLRNNPCPDFEDLESTFQGNLCRCTGYRAILDGYRTFTNAGSCNGAQITNGTTGGCCKTNGTNGCCMQKNGIDEDAGSELFNSSDFIPLDSTQEPIFPSELQLSDKFDTQNLFFEGKRVTWHRPQTLNEFVSLRGKHPNDSRIIIGNSEIGVEVKFKNCLYPILMCPSHIPELTLIEHLPEGIRFGAAVTLSNIQKELVSATQKYKENQTRIFKAVIEMLRWFAGPQIRNVGVIGGNIMTASPISDLNPLLMVAGAKLTVRSETGGTREVVMDGKFFTGYRKTVVKPEEVVVSVLMPFSKPNEYFYGYKQARRREDDIAIVNAGMRVHFEPNSNAIKDISLAYGGMSFITVMAEKTMRHLVGKRWEDDMLPDIFKLLAEDLPLAPSAPGGMIEYRRSLTTSFFFQFYLTVLNNLKQIKPDLCKSSVPSEARSLLQNHHEEPLKSFQFYQEVDPEQAQTDDVGRPISHLSALKQATGEAVYIDDIPKFEDELYLALVTSKHAHAVIESIDATEALGMEGVKDFLSAKDLPGHKNILHSFAQDEEIFASEKVTCVGQTIGAIVAVDQTTAQRAAKLVEVKYSQLKPIITIQEAIEAKSFHFAPRTIAKGENIEKALTGSEHIVEGEFHMGGQDHFYLETHATLAVPKEDGEMELFSSTQNPTESQFQVAHALGVQANRVVCRVKRMGGGFGGKETRTVLVCIPVSLAASKLGKPVRCMLDRDEDMAISGGRHPFHGFYKVGFTRKGEITALNIDIYSNGGNTVDLSTGILERALFHSDNVYKIPNVKVTGTICKTNLPSNTAFRGFGGPQGMMVTESWMTHVADYLKMDPLHIREMNMYNEGDLTHFNQKLEFCTVRRCWSECFSKSDFATRRKSVDSFNRENRWIKRGLSLTPTKFGISFTVPHLNQAGALAHIYTDGSVLLTHGGTEMGQGLHTKMIQIASRSLGIPVSKIYISETSTDKVPNTSATAASASSDLNGMAVLDACNQLNERLEPFKKTNKNGTWEDWVKMAYLDAVSLSAAGFYKTPDLGYSFETNSGMPFNYFCYGVACAEVEINCLTGDHTVLRTDIVMDVGRSLNPAIDIGQVEGGFMQGYGLVTLEEIKYSPDGFLFTRGPGTYKIPGFGDIPKEFNVSLLKSSSNPRAVYSSKAIGEPPLFLAAAVFFALKDAIKSARKDEGIEGPFRLDSPATVERIRIGCTDSFIKQFPPAKEGTFKPWATNV